jgi:hypothetical protein
MNMNYLHFTSQFQIGDLPFALVLGAVLNSYKRLGPSLSIS